MTQANNNGLREQIRRIIFEADTPAGKSFDVLLIVAIGLSVLVVMLDSVESIQQEYHSQLYAIEWFFTILFTIEYAVRLICIGHPLKYAYSFFGVVDLLAVLPTYLSLFFPGTQYITTIRILRVLRVFRILKYAQYVSEGDVIMRALIASRQKITVFIFGVIALVTILGSLMYMIESAEDGFTSIPRCIYWAIVTLTTVGYGDISPQTSLGQMFAAIVMIVGYSIIAVPTGIVSVEISKAMRDQDVTTRACPHCSLEGHDQNAVYCKHCGDEL